MSLTAMTKVTEAAMQVVMVKQADQVTTPVGQ